MCPAECVCLCSYYIWLCHVMLCFDTFLFLVTWRQGSLRVSWIWIWNNTIQSTNMGEMHRRSADLIVRGKGLGEESWSSDLFFSGFDSLRFLASCFGYAHVRLDGTVVHGGSISNVRSYILFYPCIVVWIGSSRPLVEFIRVRVV